MNLEKYGFPVEMREELQNSGEPGLIRYVPDGDSRIVRTLPRKTFFSRLDPTPGRGEQAVAANFDYVFIMQSLNHDFNEKRMERYMTLAWQSGACPVIVLTKADLQTDYEEYLCTARQDDRFLWLFRCRKVEPCQCAGGRGNYGHQRHPGGRQQGASYDNAQTADYIEE